MNPIPLSVGMLQFTIERHKKGFNRLHPSYYMYLENTSGKGQTMIQVLYAKKRAFNKTANYLISMGKNTKERKNDLCLGKLRANVDSDEYVLYDSGENYTKVSKTETHKARNEHAVYLYRYEPCYIGNIRKMVTIIPALVPMPHQSSQTQDLYLALGKDQNGQLVKMLQKSWKPLKVIIDLRILSIGQGYIIGYLSEGWTKEQQLPTLYR